MAPTSTRSDYLMRFATWWETVAAFPFEVAFIVTWMLVGAAYLIEPSVVLLSPVGRHVGAVQYVWAVLYVLAGPIALVGLALRDARLRVAGLSMFGGGLFAQFVAAATYNFEPRAFTYAVNAAACALRAGLIVRSSRGG